MRRYFQLLVAFVILLTTTSYVQAMWPSFFLKAKIQALFSYWLLFLTVVVEIWVLRSLLPSESLVKIAVTTFFMNQASAIITTGLLIGIDSALALAQRCYITYVVGQEKLSFIQENFLNVVYVGVIYVATVLLNSIVEWAIAQLYFAQINEKKLFWLLILVNGLSVGIGMFGLLGYEYWFGAVKTKPPYLGVPKE